MEGIGESAAVLLKVAGQIGRKARLADAVQSCPMTDVETAGAYLLERYAGETHEIVYELCLDRKGKLLACKRLNDGGGRPPPRWTSGRWWRMPSSPLPVR